MLRKYQSTVTVFLLVLLYVLMIDGEKLCDAGDWRAMTRTECIYRCRGTLILLDAALHIPMEKTPTSTNRAFPAYVKTNTDRRRQFDRRDFRMFVVLLSFLYNVKTSVIIGTWCLRLPVLLFSSWEPFSEGYVVSLALGSVQIVWDCNSGTRVWSIGRNLKSLAVHNRK